MNPKTKYLWNQIKDHIKRFFTSDAQDMIHKTDIVFVSFEEAISLREKIIAIPVNIESPFVPQNIYKAQFNGTQVTLWNKFTIPQDKGWVCLPDECCPIWYQHETGTIIPAFNLFNNLLNLLTFAEEKEITSRDRHGRFTATMSTRNKLGLLEVPAFNEAVALLVAACSGLQKQESPVYDLNGLLKPPVLILSHDNDILLGNDFWTQMVRIYRIFEPLMRFKKTDYNNLRWIIQNSRNPRQYYFDDISRMVAVEQKYGFASTFYFLNGKNGRFGARSGSPIIGEAIKYIPLDWEVGIHYNYDTYLDEYRFKRQVDELQLIAGKELISGRGHYLRFDSLKSLHFLCDRGILCDETAGYSDRIGYRCGIAGMFQPYDELKREAIPIWEMPLNIMDSTLLEQYSNDPIATFRGMLFHLSKVGGALSLLWHPGMICNPEFPESIGIYSKLLETAYKIGAEGSPCVKII